MSREYRLVLVVRRGLAPTVMEQATFDNSRGSGDGYDDDGDYVAGQAASLMTAVIDALQLQLRSE